MYKAYSMLLPLLNLIYVSQTYQKRERKWCLKKNDRIFLFLRNIKGCQKMSKCFLAVFQSFKASLIKKQFYLKGEFDNNL